MASLEHSFKRFKFYDSILSVWGQCLSLSMMEEKTKATNADHCKRYREKNAENYKIKEASQKNLAPLKLKADKSAYEQYK